MMQTPQEQLLVINGDIPIRVDFRTMPEYHQEHHDDYLRAQEAVKTWELAP